MRFFSFISLLTLVLANTPDWDDDPGGYELSATIVGGIILSDGEPLADEGDLFAAFDGDGNVRGLAVQLSPPFGPYEGEIVYEMTIRSNAAGDLLSFQYYDISEDTVLDIAETYEFVINDQLGDVTDPVFYNINFHYSIELDGIDLVSFYALPANRSVENMFAEIENFNPAIMGEGAAAYYDNMWIGSLTEIEPVGGYWIIIEDNVELNVAGIPTDPSTVYNLHNNSNLISYPFAGSALIEETIPENAQGSIDAIFGEGSASMNNNSQWQGSLTNLSGTEGYWFITNADIAFTYNPPEEGTLRKASPIRSVPLEYTFTQSTQQAFYFINSATIGGEAINNEDLIIAYNGDVIVGSRYWYGDVTDVPAMGKGMGNVHTGYCSAGDIVTFQVWDDSEEKLVSMKTDIETMWQNLGLTVVNLSAKIIPDKISFNSVYPNPFNPVTMLSFNIPDQMDVQLVVYDIMGRVVSALANGQFKTGHHELRWDASQQSSGIYFVKLHTGEYMKIKKLMLVK